MNSKLTVRFLIFGVFLALIVLMKLGFHEMWKDEWQAWLVARDMSLTEMLGFLHYEGHGALWYLWLKPWTSLSFLPESTLLTLSHTVLMAGFLYILFVRLDSTWWVKLLFMLGYFPLYEYGVINRGYVLILLLGLAAVWCLQTRKSIWLLTTVLFLLCQTEVYGVLMAGSLGLYYFLTVVKKDKSLMQSIKQIIPLMLGLLLGALLFIWAVFPRGEVEGKQGEVYVDNPLEIEHILNVVSGQLGSTFITPLNLLTQGGLLLVAALAALILLYFLFRGTRGFWPMLSYLVTAIIFGIFFYEGGLRHWGSAWILCGFMILLLDSKSRLIKSKKWIAVALLILQIPYGLIAVARDVSGPFTETKRTGTFLREDIPAEALIIGINPMEMAPIIGYAGRPMYFLPEGEKRTYFSWLEKIYLPPQEEMRLFGQYKQADGVLICSDRLLPAERYPDLELWKSFDEKNMKKEYFYIYTLNTK